MIWPRPVDDDAAARSREASQLLRFAPVRPSEPTWQDQCTHYETHVQTGGGRSVVFAIFHFAVAHPGGGDRADRGTRLVPEGRRIARPFGFPVTNSMVVTWIVALGLIVFAQFATRNMKQVPEASQNLLEWLVESLYGFLEGLLGAPLARKTFWFFGTVFIFILASNWLGLVPGVGSMGWGHYTAEGFQLEEPFFRGANADVNLTLAMALVFFACWIVWGLQALGPMGFFKEMFAPKGTTTGALKVLMVVVFFAAGLLEVISILFRPVRSAFDSTETSSPVKRCSKPWRRCRTSPGWSKSPFTFWNCSSGWFRRWCSCC